MSTWYGCEDLESRNVKLKFHFFYVILNFDIVNMDGKFNSLVPRKIVIFNT